MSKDADGYDWQDDANKCYALAIRELRLKGIREGRYEPLPNDPEEMAAAQERIDDGKD